jgi:hypothetical protein
MVQHRLADVHTLSSAAPSLKTAAASFASGAGLGLPRALSDAAHARRLHIVSGDVVVVKKSKFQARAALRLWAARRDTLPVFPCRRTCAASAS